MHDNPLLCVLIEAWLFNGRGRVGICLAHCTTKQMRTRTVNFRAV